MGRHPNETDAIEDSFSSSVQKDMDYLLFHYSGKDSSQMLVRSRRLGPNMWPKQGLLLDSDTIRRNEERLELQNYDRPK